MSLKAKKCPGWLELLSAVQDVRDRQYWPFLSVWLLEMAVQDRATETHLQLC